MSWDNPTMKDYKRWQKEREDCDSEDRDFLDHKIRQAESELFDLDVEYTPLLGIRLVLVPKKK